MDEMGCEVCVVAEATTWTDVETVEPLAGALMLTPAKQEVASNKTVAMNVILKSPDSSNGMLATYRRVEPA